MIQIIFCFLERIIDISNHIDSFELQFLPCYLREDQILFRYIFQKTTQILNRMFHLIVQTLPGKNIKRTVNIFGTAVVLGEILSECTTNLYCSILYLY